MRAALLPIPDFDLSHDPSTLACECCDL